MALSPYDQSIYDAGYKYIPQSQYLVNPFQIPSGSENEVPTGLPAIYQPGGSGGGGGGALQAGSPMTDYNNFYKFTSDKYFNNQATPNVDDLYQSKLDQTFMGMPSYRQQQLTGPDMGEYIGSGTDIPLEKTMAGNIQSKLGAAKGGIQDLMGKIGGLGPVSFLMNKMDRFGSLPVADQEFIKMNMGYTGPTVFGDNNSGLSKDPFGINTRSALGNYAEYVGDKYGSLGDILSGKMSEKYGVEFDPETGTFVGKNAAYANKMNKMNLAKYNFYKQQTLRRDLDRKTAEANKQKELKAALARAQQEIAAKGYQDYGSGGASAETQASYEGDDGSYAGASTQDYGGGEKDGGFIDGTNRRMYYMDGGLADLVDIYD